MYKLSLGKKKKGLRKKKKKKRGLRQNPDLVGNKYIDATTYSRTLLKPPSLEIRNPNIQPVNRAMWGQYRDPNSIKRRPDCKYGHATTLRRLVPLLNHFRDTNPKPPDVGTLVDTSRVNGYNCTIKKKKRIQFRAGDSIDTNEMEPSLIFTQSSPPLGRLRKIQISASG